MFAQAVITPARSLLNDVNANGRWSDSTLLNFLDLVSKELMRDVKFPPGRITAPSVAGTQEYQMPDSVIKIYAVYVKGQLYTEAGLDTLEGHQIQRYDQSGFGTQVAGSGGPTGNVGQYAPRWTVQPPLSTPVANNWCYPRPDAQGWYGGQPPRYYIRGGFIGFVPITQNGPNVVNNVTIDDICLDAAMSPPQVISLTQSLWFPDIFLNALTWGVVKYAKFSDDTQSTKESRNFALSESQNQTGKMRMWASTYIGDAAMGPKMQTNRSLYFGRKIRNYGGGGYP